MTIFYAFLRRRKKTAVSHTFPLVHDLAISTALLSLFPCPYAISRLIDTADLFLGYAVSIVRFYNYWRTKSASSYSHLYLERMYRFIRLYVLPLQNFHLFPSYTSHSLFNSSLQRYCCLRLPLFHSIYCVTLHCATTVAVSRTSRLKKDNSCNTLCNTRIQD